jgi:hypothetical protein
MEEVVIIHVGALGRMAIDSHVRSGPASINASKKPARFSNGDVPPTAQFSG